MNQLILYDIRIDLIEDDLQNSNLNINNVRKENLLFLPSVLMFISTNRDSRISKEEIIIQNDCFF
jgi:hypothetical protein